MSRRKKTPAGTDVLYGLLKLKCPYGHELGAIFQSAIGRSNNVYRMTTEQLDTFKRDERPGVGGRVDNPELVTPGQPLRGMCPACKHERRGKYWYEESWEIVDSYLRVEVGDTHSAQRTITLH